MKLASTAAALLGVTVYLIVPASGQGPGSGVPAAILPSGVEVSADVHHDVSPPLREMPFERHPRPLRVHPVRPIPVPATPQAGDPVLQTAILPALATTGITSFDGVGVGFTGPNGKFSPDAAPPDTNGAVGATQYVEWVNESFAVFDKTTHAAVLGPRPGNSLWSGFGGGCEQNNDGDPIAQYDKLANRWVMTQFSVSTTPYLQCVAVSATSDATGSYYRYAFQYSNFPDYPKLGVWPDAYYLSFNMFSATFLGGRACAYDRNAMLNGWPATQQCFQLSSSFGGLLPSDVDGTTPPPAGAPNDFLNFGSNSLNVWRFHVDWSNAANTTFAGPTNIPVAAFAAACKGGTCIPQSDTRQKLDSLGDRLMYRLAYRNFGSGVESLVVNHSVNVGSSRKSTSTGVRWYELRNLAGTPTIYQQGTYAPDASFRWMGSAAMDKAGNLAIGYSVSSSTMHPAIRVASRAPGDPLGTLGAEESVIAGTGSQLQSLNRWGDYSAMSVDPVDDCTFWYADEYLKSNGTFNWSTRIATFRFATCQ